MIINEKFINFNAEAVNQKNELIKNFNLKKELGKNGTFLFFWTQNFHNDAISTIATFNDLVPFLEKHNINIYGISVDSAICHQAFVEKMIKENKIKNLNLTLISDLSKDISRDYFVLDEELNSCFALFFINQHGYIKYVEMSTNLLEINQDKLLKVINNSKYDKKSNKTF